MTIKGLQNASTYLYDIPAQIMIKTNWTTEIELFWLTHGSWSLTRDTTNLDQKLRTASQQKIWYNFSIFI